MKKLVKIVSIALICGADTYLISMFKRMNEVQEAPIGVTIMFSLVILLFSLIAWAVSLSICDKINE